MGLPLARAFTERGIAVLGFDVDPVKVAKLEQGQSYIGHISDATIRQMGEHRFQATSAFDRLDEPDVIIICVPTPLTEAREPDLAYIVNSTKAIARKLRPGQLIVLESTTYPGTTRQVVLPILGSTGLEPGRDFFLAFSPEREDPGNPKFSAPTIPKVVGGLEPASLRTGCGSLRQGDRPGRSRLQPRGRGSVQDPRKHLPGHQYRAGQRAEDALRPHGHQRLGSDRRSQDQTLRLSGRFIRGPDWEGTAFPSIPST